MASTLHYYRERSQDSPSRGGRGAIVLSVLTVVCFALPFGLLYAFDLFQYAPSPGGGKVATIVMIALTLWFASGCFGLWGTAAGILTLVRDRPRLGTILATSVSATVILVELVAVAAGFLRTLG